MQANVMGVSLNTRVHSAGLTQAAVVRGSKQSRHGSCFLDAAFVEETVLDIRI